MYPEFIAIYVGLGVLAVLMIVVIVLLALILKKLKNNSFSQKAYHLAQGNANMGCNGGMGVVFCAHCGTQYDGTTRVCPKCGAAR